MQEEQASAGLCGGVEHYEKFFVNVYVFSSSVPEIETGQFCGDNGFINASPNEKDF